MFPDTPLPPEPIITRWGTWLKACIYYAENFEKLAKFVNELDAVDARCIRQSQLAIANPRVRLDLAFIKSNFACIPEAIKKLEAQGLPLAESIRIFSSIKTNLEAIPRREFLNKYITVLNKNNGLTLVSKISHILEGNALQENDDFINRLSPDELSSFKFAPLTSCDVERSFSAYKRILEDTRRRFLFDNLRKSLIIHCNKL